jgi:RNA 2',3'-cyclic 3'-phosphodiesterase
MKRTTPGSGLVDIMGGVLYLANSTANTPPHCIKQWNMLSSFPVKTVRIFIAISLPDEIHDYLSVISTQLKKNLVDGVVRWVKVTNIHLTLKFLGEIPEAEVDRLKKELASPVAHHMPFNLMIENIGVFPNLHCPRILWVGLRESMELIQLQRTVELVTQNMGYAVDERDFSAHLTLGRVNQNANQQQLLNFGKILTNSTVGGMSSFIVKSIGIYRSELNAGGPIYTKLQSIPLKKEF